MSEIQPGDVVVKVSGPNRFMRRGTVVRVDGLCRRYDCSGHGLIFNSYVGQSDSYCDCFNPKRFRKISPADEQFIHQVRALKPVREDA